MKIGIVSFGGFYPLEIGGSSVFIHYLVKELEKLGNDIILFVKLSNDKEKVQLEKIIRTNFTKTTVIPIYAKYDLKFFLNFPNLLLKLRESLKTFLKVVKDLDIVYYNTPPVDLAFPFTIFSKHLKKPQLYFLHQGILTFEMGDILHRYGLPSVGQFFFRSLFKTMLKSSLFSKILVPNEYARGLAIKTGVPEKKIQVIPVGVDIAEFQQATPLQLEGTPKILYVGRLDKIKRVHVLIKAFSLILKWFPDSHLYIVGSGSQMNSLKSQVTQLNMHSHVTFTGRVTNRALLPRYHKACDIFVCTSLMENHPIAILEAMAAKMPIVVTDVGGVNTIIKNEYNGLLVSKNGWKGFAEKIKVILDDTNLARKISENAFEDVKINYSYPIIASKFNSLCKSLLL